jgi:hypothetical protein
MKDFYQEIEASLKAHEDFFKTAKDAYELYALQGEHNKGTDYNLMRQMVNITLPHIFNQPPKIVTKKRSSTNNLVDNIAAQSIKKLLTYNNDCIPFYEVFVRILTDFLVTGRGVSWISYDFNVTEDDEVIDERVLIERVLPCDFIHGNAESWTSVPWVGRAIYLMRKDLKDKFGLSKEKIDALHFSDTFQDNDEIKIHHPSKQGLKEYERARIWEIYDREAQKVYYYSSDSTTERPIMFGSKDSPLKFKNFFPCPKPLLNVCGIDSIIPVSEYEYMLRDQARLDVVCNNIAFIEELIRPTSLHDKRFSLEVKQLYQSRNATKTHPVDNLSTMIADNQEIFYFLPLELFSSALEGQRMSRDDILKNAFEKSGISDIMRGISEPTDAAGTVQTKQRNSSSRVQQIRTLVDYFLRDTLELQAEAACQMFSDELISVICEYPPQAEMPVEIPVEVLQTNPELAQLYQQKVMAFQQYQPFAEALEVLRNVNIRDYRINVETQSTLAEDDAQEKQNAMEFSQALSTSLASLSDAKERTPEILPLVMSSLKIILNKFSPGQEFTEEIEGALNESLQKIQESAMQKQQQEMQMQQEQMQMQQQKQQADIEMQQAQLQLQQEAARQKALELEISRMALEHDKTRVQSTMQKVQIDAAKAEGDLAIRRGELKVKETQTAADIRDADADNKREDYKLTNNREFGGI